MKAQIALVLTFDTNQVTFLKARSIAADLSDSVSNLISNGEIGTTHGLQYTEADGYCWVDTKYDRDSWKDQT